MADVVNAFLSGRATAQAESEHEQAMADNKLRAMVLKHQLSALKLEDALRAQDLAQRRATMGIGQDQSDTNAPSSAPSAPPSVSPSGQGGGSTPTGPYAGLTYDEAMNAVRRLPQIAAGADASPSAPSIVPGVLERVRASLGGGSALGQMGPRQSEDVPISPPSDPWTIGAAPAPPQPPAPTASATPAPTAPRPRASDRVWLPPISIPELGIDQPGQWWSASAAQAEEARRAIALKRAEQPPVTTPPGGTTSQVNPETGKLEPVITNANLPPNASLDAHLLDAVTRGDAAKQKSVLSTMSAIARAKGQSLSDQYAAAVQEGDTVRANTLKQAIHDVAEAGRDPAMQALALQLKALDVKQKEAGLTPPGDFTKQGPEFLATIPTEWQKTVEKIANYDEDPTKVASMRGGMRETLMKWVNQVNPEYRESQYSVRNPTRKAFTTGTQGQQINAMNTAIGHLDQFAAVADALKNGTFTPGNALWNSVKQMFGSNAPTNFGTLKGFLDGELGSIVKKGAATEGEFARLREDIGKASSPGQLTGFIQTAIPLLGSKLSALNYQYHQAMGADDPFSALSPEAKSVLEKFGFDPSNPTIASGARKVPAPAVNPFR